MVAFYTAAMPYEKHGQAADQYASLRATDGSLPPMVFQRVPEPKHGKNRMHLDVIVDDIEAEAKRFESLGATRVSAEPVREYGIAWIVMLDPEGNELCLCDS